MKRLSCEQLARFMYRLLERRLRISRHEIAREVTTPLKDFP